MHVTKRQQPFDTDSCPGIERRRKAREDTATVGWETIVMQRVAGRVESLRDRGSSTEEAQDDQDWERSAREVLQRRIRELKRP